MTYMTYIEFTIRCIIFAKTTIHEEKYHEFPEA